MQTNSVGHLKPEISANERGDPVFVKRIFSSIGALDVQMSVCMSVDTFEFLCYISIYYIYYNVL